MLRTPIFFCLFLTAPPTLFLLRSYRTYFHSFVLLIRPFYLRIHIRVLVSIPISSSCFFFFRQQKITRAQSVTLHAGAALLRGRVLSHAWWVLFSVFPYPSHPPPSYFIFSPIPLRAAFHSTSPFLLVLNTNTKTKMPTQPRMTSRPGLWPSGVFWGGRVKVGSTVLVFLLDSMLAIYGYSRGLTVLYLFSSGFILSFHWTYERFGRVWVEFLCGDGGSWGR